MESKEVYMRTMRASRERVWNRAIGRTELEAYDMTANSARHSLEIANRILDIADKKMIGLTMMQLHKLVYFAHGWHLAIYGKPLTSDSPEVWRFGPVYLAVYKAFRSSGEEHIKGRAKITAKETTAETDELLEQVVDSLGDISASKLSKMTHVKGSPWYVTMIGSGYFREIPNDTIKEYFLDEIGRG